MTEAGRGDWTGAPINTILDTGLLGMGLGGWGIAMLGVTGLDHTPKEESRTTRFEAHLIAMLDGPLGSGRIVFGPHATQAECAFAQGFIGRRFEGVARGSVTTI